MTDIIKPFKILSVQEEADGRMGVTFESEKVESITLLKRRLMGIRSYLSVAAGKDIDEAVFEHLQESGWLG
jgi:hypothetical protein